MSNEQVGRDAELRRMLVATASAAPARTSRRRTTIALLSVFVAAGALTGGAVSAAALNAPAPAPTVNVEQMARGLTHDDTQLFGTPFILTGEGETNVILGTPASGATDVLIAFNCLDAGTYTLLLDGDQAMTIRCDDESTSKAGGGSSFPIDAASGREHVLTIETGNNERYAIWASWATPEPRPEPSAAQRDAMADGAVTEAEYRAGFTRYSQCMSNQGYSLGAIDDTGTIITYVNSSEAVQSGAEGRCYTAEFADLDAAWQVANE